EALLRTTGWNTFYDEKGAIGRRYRRQDEDGTPFCITIDGDTLENNQVTVRHRDSMEQETVEIANLVGYIANAIQSWKRA
ncbi:MAG: glycyl-tRNA synthetase, partial [Planctomycetota bacterium]